MIGHGRPSGASGLRRKLGGFFCVCALTVSFVLTSVSGTYSVARADGDTPSEKRAKRPSARERRAERKRRAREAKESKQNAVPTAAPSKEKDVPRKDGGKERGPDTAASRAAASAAAGNANVDSEVVKEGDTSVKVMRFSGLDLEGRLKSPQLLYFVNRVRAEFERPRLPHRSFMPELDRSTRRDPL